MREKTTAHRRYQDDVPEVIKKQRLERMIQLFRLNAEKLNRQQIGTLHLVLVEGFSKRSNLNLAGRNNSNTKVIFPAGDVPDEHGLSLRNVQPGDYVVVQINDATSQVLKGIPLYSTTLQDFERKHELQNPTFENIEYVSMM